MEIARGIAQRGESAGCKVSEVGVVAGGAVGFAIDREERKVTAVERVDDDAEPLVLRDEVLGTPEVPDPERGVEVREDHAVVRGEDRPVVALKPFAKPVERVAT